MRIAIINGPNLNLLGKREIDIYGNMPFESWLEQLNTAYPQVQFSYYQSNVEGELINELQRDWGATVYVTAIFDAPTVSQFEEYLKRH